ncbi:MAG: sigma-70 family RNA polymerase sigma factor [Planctomyces sp.]|nr:sigma-70 family RNA polymerase sigma factor [Planctomyces sp.]
MTTDDSEWLRRLRAGDDRAWTEWFDTVGPKVWKYLSRLIGPDRDAVSDHVQEVFLAAIRGLSGFDPSAGSVVAWLFGIAHRQAALYWRKQKRLQRVSIEIDLDLIDSILTVRSSLPEQQELTIAVRLTLSEMPDDMAGLLIGRYLDQRTTADLAGELDITEDAVRSRLVRARDRFRTAFLLLHRELV